VPQRRRRTGSSQRTRRSALAGGKRVTREKVLGWTSIAVTVVLVAAVLGAYFNVRSKLDSIGRITVADTGHRPPRYTNAVNILLLGSDSRSGRNARIGGSIGCDCSDTILVAHISPGRGKVTVLSIPRDTEVPQYACTAVDGTPGQLADSEVLEPINQTLEAGGPECVRTTVEQQTGIFINNTIQLNFTGFEQVINDVGGVNVCVPVAISDPITPGPDGHGSGLKLKAGRQHIWGKVALEFWRARYALADGSDLARINRDQYLMGQIFKGVIHSKLLSSPTTLYRVFGDVAKSISTDASISDLIKIASSLQHVSSSNVQFVTAPNEPYPADTAKLQFAQPAAGTMFAAIARDKTLPKQKHHKGKKGIGHGGKGTAKGGHGPKTVETATVQPSQVNVNVLNGTLIQGLAGKAATDLTTAGFTVVGQPANAAASDYTHSVIEYGSAADEAAAKTLARQIPSATIELTTGLTAGTVTLILGSDFTALNAKAAGSHPLGNLSGSFKASSACRNSAFFGANLPAPAGQVRCGCSAT
jgi:LCP family protein required for cell wall assembly